MMTSGCPKAATAPSNNKAARVDEMNFFMLTEFPPCDCEYRPQPMLFVETNKAG
jgi:hypothetical protein